jgi:nucleotide-binding universal stress UspA family protein
VSQVAVANDVDLIVVGTRGHSAVVGAVLGSVTQRLLHVSPCPVLAIPHPPVTRETATPKTLTATS